MSNCMKCRIFWGKQSLCEDCRFVPKDQPPSLFDRITASPEVLAEKFIEERQDQWDDDDYAYYSYLTNEWYASREKAFAATLAKLKEVVE